MWRNAYPDVKALNLALGRRSSPCMTFSFALGLHHRGSTLLFRVEQRSLELATEFRL